jgi:hypothetical protein
MRGQSAALMAHRSSTRSHARQSIARTAATPTLATTTRDLEHRHALGPHLAQRDDASSHDPSCRAPITSHPPMPLNLDPLLTDSI